MTHAADVNVATANLQAMMDLLAIVYEDQEVIIIWNYHWRRDHKSFAASPEEWFVDFYDPRRAGWHTP